VVKTSEMLPPPTDLSWEPPFDEEPAPGRNRWAWGIPLALVTAVLVALAFIQLPYYAISPGEARQINDLVAVTGGEVYLPDGELLLTTVALRHVNAYEALIGWIDGDTEVVHEDLIFPPEIDDRRAYNLALMRSSKETALLVAFRRLGHPVTERGEGALVLAVEPGFPAQGLLEPGDVVVGIDGQKITIGDQAVSLLATRAPGDRITLDVLSLTTEQTRDVTVVLAAREDGTPVLGVHLQTFAPRFDFPFDVTIDSGSIGGPSAGLAFALAVIDHLTPGELTGGTKVAVTGTIDVDGTIGPVGGVVQKVAAVKESGASVFLVPADEADEAAARAGSAVRVIGVATLDEALAALVELGGNANELPAPNPG
jgi:PDZ domain-containing protein